MINWKIVTDITTLLYIKCITSKNLLNSTGNYSILCNGGGPKMVEESGLPHKFIERTFER